MDDRRLNTIDLFSGCGGLSLGFHNSGFNIMLGIDKDEPSLVTYRKNFPNAKGLNIDLSKKGFVDDVSSAIDGKPVDVIVAGPPCQGFSLTGTRNFEDSRNKLYLAVIKAVDSFKPKAFLIENVTGISTLYNGQVKNEIVRRLTDIGYNVSARMLCAADYGVPQIRKRFFFVGILNKYGNIALPNATHHSDNYISCKDAIGDLPSRVNELGYEEDKYDSPPYSEYQFFMRGNCNTLYNHVATNHTQLVKDVIALVPEGCNYKVLPPGIGESRRFNEAWTRYHSEKPSRTIDTGHRNHFHYKYNRVPTIRENARLQSFPDWFVFLGTKTQQNRQVGNAVPPLLAQRIAERISEYLYFSAEGLIGLREEGQLSLI